MMWHTQPENSHTDFATTAGNVTPTIFCKKTGADSRSAQKITNQKNRSLSPSSLMAMLLLSMSLVPIGLSRLLFMLVHLATQPFKVLGVLTGATICSPTRSKETSLVLVISEPFLLLLRPLMQLQESVQRAMSTMFRPLATQ